MLNNQTILKVLVACEESQEVAKQFRALGHEAFSCDIQDCSGGHPEWHIKGDAINEAYSGKYDLMIAHPPCTYLANSGVRWLNIVDGYVTNRERWQSLLWGRRLFVDLLNAPINTVAIENPIPHKHATLPKYTQIIQPWQFGHGETKATCLWLRGLPKLKPTDIVEGREQKVWKMPPSVDRQKLRSKTYSGIAKAMAEQWSKYLLNGKAQ
jgi:hypothetical protein